MDELLEELAVAGAARAPDVGEQPLGGEGVAGVGEQDLEQAQLQAGQPHGLAAAHRHRLQLEVEAEVAGGERHRLLLAGPPQQGPHAGEQGARAEGLGEVVVGAEVERLHLVLLGVPAR